MTRKFESDTKLESFFHRESVPNAAEALKVSYLGDETTGFDDAWFCLLKPLKPRKEV